VDAKETLDALLKRNRELEKAAGPGANNHVPMVLIALYGMGGGSERMIRYQASFDRRIQTARTGPADLAHITREDWTRHLGRGEFESYVDFFDRWTREVPLDTVLGESVPVLMKGVCTEAYHALLRLGYALDYGSREEAVSALSYWASKFYPGPEFDCGSNPVEPEVFFAEIMASASGMQIEPVNSIDGRLLQVYACKAIATQWTPIRISHPDPLAKMAALIMELFRQSQHFTLLHALTSCEALRHVLPYLKNPQQELSRYWHSVCAAFLTVQHSGFETGRDSIVTDGASWEDLLMQAVASEEAMEHRIKLTYSCWLEFQRSHREGYRALASREIRRASPFV